MAGPAEMIELAVSIELECAGLYEVFARCFQGRAEMVYFWRHYAEAERYHAASIRILQATFTPAAEGDADPQPSRTFLEQLRALRQQYEQPTTPITIREALNIARRVEESSEELHGRTRMLLGRPEFEDLFAKMAEEDRVHRDTLTVAEARWSV